MYTFNTPTQKTASLLTHHLSAPFRTATAVGTNYYLYTFFRARGTLIRLPDEVSEMLS